MESGFGRSCAKVFLRTPASARRMTDPSASPLAELESAVRRSKSDRATTAALDAIRAKVPLMEVVRTSARAFVTHYDGAAGVAPRSLVALSSAANLIPVMQPRFQPLPILQAVSFVAAAKKADAPAKPAAVVSGEITHLGRSFLFAVRDGNRPEAESIFLGMLAEGKERKMAGDMLFRAAIEDMGEAGRKLMVAVKSWQLAHSLGFKEARLLLRPAVQYMVSGPRDRTAFEAILAALGKEWVDLEALASGGRPLDQEGRTKVRDIATAPNPSTSNAPGEGEERCHLAGEFDARRPLEAGARTRAYLSGGYSPSRLLDVLANYACRDSAVSNDGISLIFADTCVAEFLASKAPEIPMGLAKMIAASPKDQAAYNTWAPHLAA